MDTKVLVFILFIVFGWSSWMDISGVFVELPIMVHKQPEGWNLPAYFTIIIQFANIGPITYGLLRKFRTSEAARDRLETATIYIITIVGALTMLFLAFFWQVTSYINGVEHSTVLLVLIFFLALVDCTSSVTFLPFAGKFRAEYTTAYYIGEGMCSFLPATLAFVQGSGEYECINTTTEANSTNTTSYFMQPRYDPLLFPVRDFFLALSSMIALSVMAFSLLNYSGYCKTEFTKSLKVKPEQEKGTVLSILSPVADDYKYNETSAEVEVKEGSRLTRMQLAFLVCVVSLLAFIIYGFLPSLQTYALLPYGHIYYSLGVKLSALSGLLAFLSGFCRVPQSFIAVGVLTGIVVACASYIIVIASYSPTPPVEGMVAAVCMVIVWVTLRAVISFLYIYITSMARKEGVSGLFWIGVGSQAGAGLGSILAFVLTSMLNLFQSAPPC